MERFIISELDKWKASKRRKPLILRGIRQCGKTWALREFGKSRYENMAYINFDDMEEFAQFFETTKDAKRILQNIAMAIGSAIKPEKTLIVFDEIQACPEALASLKYFCEGAPEYHIACAGSLLGVALNGKAGFPVGKVDFLDMAPMNFSEFLLASGDGNLRQYIRSIDSLDPQPDAFFNPLLEKLKMYFITGGMPEAVRAWAEDGDVEETQKILSAIIEGYERDFSKHAGKYEYPKLSLIWKSIPSQLSRENKKFLYSAVKEGARAREYEYALQWLCDAGLALKIFRVSAPGLPLSAYDELGAFKIYLPDVGLLRRLSRLSPSAITEGDRLFAEFKGALSENYVLQGLMGTAEDPPRYWAVDNPRYEVDFLAQHENEIIPIEVNAGTNVEARSLKKYRELFPAQTKIAARFSLKNLVFQGGVLNVPLFLIDRAPFLFDLALKR